MGNCGKQSQRVKTIQLAVMHGEQLPKLANEKRILDLDISWPGSTHDSRIWNSSQAKIYIESQRRFLVAGDSGYPIKQEVIHRYIPMNKKYLIGIYL